MTSKLYVAEKPDAAKELANYLAKKSGLPAQKQTGFVRVGNDVVTWCIGHMLQLPEMEHFIQKRHNLKDTDFRTNDKGVKVLKWDIKYYPVLLTPKEIRFIPAPNTKENEYKNKQLKVIETLLKEADVIVHAADRDREGQLIVDELLEYFDVKKPVERMVFSALDDKSFEVALSTIKSNTLPEYVNLSMAARARVASDWVIGINATCALTVLRRTFLTLGRVQTPLLSVICKRFIANRDFVKKDYYVISMMFDGIKFTLKTNAGMDGTDESGRIINKSVAQRIIDELNRLKDGKVTLFEKKEEKTNPPLPFDLPSIQSEMSSRFGLSVADTTAACQTLYEKKMQTYIGTDCRYIPTSMKLDVKDIITEIHKNRDYARFAEGANLSLTSAAWDDSKISAHHAIIPTTVMAGYSNEAEKIVHGAVVARYLAQFYPPSIHERQNIEISIGDYQMTSTNKELLSAGWMSVEKNLEIDDADKEDELASKKSLLKELNQ